MNTEERWLPSRTLTLVSSITLCLLSPLVPATAQITPDHSLGAQSSIVSPNLNIRGISSNRIDGGAIRGTNLFHSFEEFNIPQGVGVYFTNPVGIENILSRVTGTNPSTILGRLPINPSPNISRLKS